MILGTLKSLNFKDFVPYRFKYRPPRNDPELTKNNNLLFILITLNHWKLLVINLLQ